MTDKPSKFRLIQFTDCHLGSDSDYKQSGINTRDSLDDVLREIVNSDIQNDMAVVTGDISCNGFDASYQLFDEILGKQLPYCWLPGNHDHLQRMNENLSVPFQHVISVAGWNLLMVDTTQFNRVEGFIPEEGLSAIESQLQAAANTPTLLFMHHPPVNVGCRWLDRQKISNSYELFNLLGMYSNVKAIFCGHVHQSQHKDDLIPVYTSPSTCFQFQVNSAEFALSNQPPGYRWIDLYDNGTFQTDVSYLNNFPQAVDVNCSGY